MTEIHPADQVRLGFGVGELFESFLQEMIVTNTVAAKKMEVADFIN